MRRIGAGMGIGAGVAVGYLASDEQRRARTSALCEAASRAVNLISCTGQMAADISYSNWKMRDDPGTAMVKRAMERQKQLDVKAGRDEEVWRRISELGSKTAVGAKTETSTNSKDGEEHAVPRGLQRWKQLTAEEAQLTVEEAEERARVSRETAAGKARLHCIALEVDFLLHLCIYASIARSCSERICECKDAGTGDAGRLLGASEFSQRRTPPEIVSI